MGIICLWVFVVFSCLNRVLSGWLGREFRGVGVWDLWNLRLTSLGVQLFRILVFSVLGGHLG